MPLAAESEAVPPPSATLELDSVEGLVGFKVGVTIVILLITAVSALVPLWISQNGTSSAQKLLTKKLPFMTAGVFIGSGLMHLLPDAVKMYNKALLSSPTMLSAKWMQEFPLVYFLSTLGCMVVWAVDLMNLGDSPKMMAVASAARPNHETSMCRVQVPRVASFGVRHRSVPSDGANVGHPCSCGDVSSPANKAFHHSATRDESKFLLSHSSVKVYSDSKPRASALEKAHRGSHLHVHSMPAVHLHTPTHPSRVVEEGDASLLDDCDVIPVDEPHEVTSEATVSEHVVFSGESPILPYLLAALFSIHSLIAGFALGVNSTSNKTAIATAVAIFSHKVIEAMSVGANFARAKESIAQERSVAVLTLYSFMTPLGIVLGMVLASELQGTAVLVVESVALSIASGSFVYLAFHEMSDEHGAQDCTPVQKVVLFGSGLFSMAALATWA